MKNKKYNIIYDYTEDQIIKEANKKIPHHIIKGPCKNCLVRPTCTEACERLTYFWINTDGMTRRQILNYINADLEGINSILQKVKEKEES